MPLAIACAINDSPLASSMNLASRSIAQRHHLDEHHRHLREDGSGERSLLGSDRGLRVTADAAVLEPTAEDARHGDVQRLGRGCAATHDVGARTGAAVRGAGSVGIVDGVAAVLALVAVKPNHERGTGSIPDLGALDVRDGLSLARLRHLDSIAV